MGTLIAGALLSALALLDLADPAHGADQGLVTGLTRNAWYWQARARSDKAEEAWKQVLEAAPDNPDALAALGDFDARVGRMQQAREKLARLSKVSPHHPDLEVLRRAVELGPRFGALVAEARKLAHEGSKAEAAAKYRALFGEAGPPGDLALEYYQTIGGAPGGWQKARDGLRRLTRRAPAEARYKLALARLLTYRDDSRREGIGMLAALADDRTVTKEATASWREALLWLAPTAADLALLRAYLKTHPGDAEVAARIERGKKAGTVQEGYSALESGELRDAERLFKESGADPSARKGLGLIAARRAAQLKKSGFAALQRGDLEEAERLFSSVPADTDARLGLALIAQNRAGVAQKNEDFAAAEELLGKAKKLAPQRKDLWDKQLQGARFWALMKKARESQAQGLDAEARARLQEAEALGPPGQRWHAVLALADLYAKAGERQKADARYREVLSAVPDQEDALRALVGLLVQDDKYAEALPLNDRLLKIAPAKALRPERLRAELLRGQAATSRKAHQLVRARRELAEARLADPTNVWVLHDLSNLLLELSAPAEAEPVVQELLRIAPGLLEAQVVQARLLHAEHQDARALAVLEALQPPPRDPAVVALRRRLQVQVRLPAAIDAAASGDRASAVRALAEMQAQASDQPDLAAQIAVAWAKVGEEKRAMSLMRQAMARAPGKTSGPRLELAASLLEAGDDEAVGQLLSGLEREPSLSAAERRSLGELRIAHAVRAADRHRERGDDGQAQAALEPVLRDFPDDARLIAADARALEHADPGRAHALYLRVLGGAPGDLEARRGAIDTALAQGELVPARALADEGLRLHGDDPRAFAVAARVALREENDAAAMRSLRRAVELIDRSQGAASRGAAPGQSGSSTAALAPGRPRLASLTPDESDALRGQLQRDIGRIQDRHRPMYLGDFEMRVRNGEPGLSQLQELRETFEAELPVGYSGRAALRVAEVELDAGDPAAYAGPRFGTGATLVSPAGQTAIGTELKVGYQSRHFDAWIASTPIGFRLFTLLGGVRLRDSVGPLTLGAEASRRSITESLLSYAGATDPATGRSWGGVVMDGGRLELGLATGIAHSYVFAELHQLTGLRVENNLRAAGGAGVTLQLADGALGQLAVGPTVTALGYQHNLRYFTYGHGGYFSPQRFVHGGLAVSLRRSGTLHYDVVAEPGYDGFSEAYAPIFPLGTPAGGGFYPGRSSDGPSFSGHAMLGWQVAEQVELGLTAAAQQAPQFQELSAGILLRVGARGR